jgi:hypothetical protein
MFTPRWLAQLLQKFVQSRGCDAVVNLSADAEIWALHALVFAELTRYADSSTQSVALHVRINSGKIPEVPSCETGTPEADHNFDRTFI